MTMMEWHQRSQVGSWQANLASSELLAKTAVREWLRQSLACKAVVERLSCFAGPGTAVHLKRMMSVWSLSNLESLPKFASIFLFRHQSWPWYHDTSHILQVDGLWAKTYSRWLMPTFTQRDFSWFFMVQCFPGGWEKKCEERQMHYIMWNINEYKSTNLGEFASLGWFTP